MRAEKVVQQKWPNQKMQVVTGHTPGTSKERRPSIDSPSDWDCSLKFQKMDEFHFTTRLKLTDLLPRSGPTDSLIPSRQANAIDVTRPIRYENGLP